MQQEDDGPPAHKVALGALVVEVVRRVRTNYTSAQHLIQCRDKRQAAGVLTGSEDVVQKQDGRTPRARATL